MANLMVFRNAREKARAEKQRHIQQMLRQGVCVEKIMARLGVSGGTVRAVRDGHARAPEKVNAAPVVTMYKQGKAPSAIASELGVSYVGIVFQLREAGYEVSGRHHINQSCPYSNDCFRCPMPDCRIDGNKAHFVNRLATDFTKEYA